MSLPKIPDIKPEIRLKRSDIHSLLLASIALEEIGLAHIINAEGEKLQQVIDSNCELRGWNSKFANLLQTNKSVNKTLKTIIMKQILLNIKLENMVELMSLPSFCDNEDDKW